MKSFFSQWQDRFPDWLTGDGPSADIVIHTRASLIRNLDGFSFPIQASEAQLKTILEETETRLAKLPGLAGGNFLHLDELSDGQRNLLREMHLATASINKQPLNRGIITSADRSLAVLVNGDDHLRFISFKSGFDPEGAALMVTDLESQLESLISFAYQDDLGYLTSAPGNLGTGLSFSALLHLPGLVLADEIDKILNALQQLRFSVRGLFGSGATVRGGLFQVSSQVTLGRDEQEIGNDFSYHLGKVLLHEKSAREQLFARDRVWLEDLVHRSYAAVRSARLITSQETFDRLSHVRLGASLGILPEIPPGLLNTLLVGQQTAHLSHAAGEDLTGSTRARSRASFLRSFLKTEN